MAAAFSALLRLNCSSVAVPYLVCPKRLVCCAAREKQQLRKHRTTTSARLVMRPIHNRKAVSATEILHKFDVRGSDRRSLARQVGSRESREWTRMAERYVQEKRKLPAFFDSCSFVVKWMRRVRFSDSTIP